VTSLRWAPPARADDADWARLLAAIEEADRHGETYGREEIDDEWASVWAHPETDALFGWDGPELVAFGWLQTQVGQAKGHRIECWGGVHPGRRGEGIGRQVLAWQLARAQEVAAALDPGVETSIRLTAMDHQADLLDLARRFGFAPVRRFLEMARPTERPLEPAPPVDGLRLEPWDPAWDAPARAAHADSFRDHWGSEPRSAEEWRQWYTGHRGFRPDLSAVAVDGTGEVAAFVLCAAYPLDWEAGAAPVEAWITTVGTRRSWRGRGAARWVLSHVLDEVAASDTGFERSILGVDADNPTGARCLYASLGFELVRTVLTLAWSPSQDELPA
jgi:ribosomal protein S18 acetylase RimI-like enzyme